MSDREQQGQRPIRLASCGRSTRTILRLDDACARFALVIWLTTYTRLRFDEYLVQNRLDSDYGLSNMFVLSRNSRHKRQGMLSFAANSARD